MFKRVKENKKGFTLAELLIVVAIIAVLVAISIPIFTSQLEKSREATDAANIRAAYAEVMSDAVMGEAVTEETTGNVKILASSGTEGEFVYTAEIKLEQKQDGWQKTDIKTIGGVDVSGLGVGNGKTVVVKYEQKTDACTITIK